MLEQAKQNFQLGVVSCSGRVETALAAAGVSKDELLAFHQFATSAELRREHQQALEKGDWVCSPFELERSGKTVWVITDPQQQTTSLHLEEP